MNNLKKTAATFFCIVMLCLLSAFSTKEASFNTAAYSDCFVVISKEFNKNCPDNYYVQWRNSCTEDMDIKYAFMRTDGRVISGVTWNVKPGATTGGSACTATGSYKFWERPSSQSSTIRFPNDKEILENW